MVFSFVGMWISLGLLMLCGVFFFYNKKPKFVLPFRVLQQKVFVGYMLVSGLLLVCVVLLPLRIQLVTDKQVVVEKNLPVQIVLDVSLSMAANDIQPSRFAAAKTSLLKLIDKLDGYSLSLITFSGKPFVAIPFSSSSNAIVSKLEHMNLGDFPPVKDFLGTAIGDALLLGVLNLQQLSSQIQQQPGIVVLITDGDSNIGFDPEQVLSYFQKTGVPVFVLGVGQEDYLIGRDTWNDDIRTNIHFPLLQKIADKTGGSFYRVFGDQTFDVFFDELAQSVLAHQTQTIQNQYISLNDYLIYLIVALLFGLLVFRILLIKRLKH